MSEKLKRCEACEEHFQWNDDPLGETENEDGSMAIEMLDEGEYMEGDE